MGRPESVGAICALIYKQFDARELKLRKPHHRIASSDQGKGVRLGTPSATGGGGVGGDGVDDNIEPSLAPQKHNKLVCHSEYRIDLRPWIMHECLLCGGGVASRVEYTFYLYLIRSTLGHHKCSYLMR